MDVFGSVSVLDHANDVLKQKGHPGLTVEMLSIYEDEIGSLTEDSFLQTRAIKATAAEEVENYDVLFIPGGLVTRVFAGDPAKIAVLRDLEKPFLNRPKDKF